MNNVTESAEPLVNIWNYAKQLLKNNLISEYGFSKKYVEAVYENTERTYQHILLFTNQKNFYAVIVVDIVHKTILGHYILDLNEKYGLIYKSVYNFQLSRCKFQVCRNQQPPSCREGKFLFLGLKKVKILIRLRRELL